MNTTTSSFRLRCTAQATLPSAMGPLLYARTDTGLCGLWFSEQKWLPSPFDAPELPDDPLLQEAAAQLDAYFAGTRQTFDLPLDLHGTPFQRAVWAALLHIERGATCTYGDVAHAVGSPSGVRAVGSAVGRNPVGIIVPCHRVIGHDGSLTGYAGGLDRKRFLLRLEGVLREDRQESLI
jgi:methylated-DNA-[protein]-cysteine S-methyltransferase